MGKNWIRYASVDHHQKKIINGPTQNRETFSSKNKTSQLDTTIRSSIVLFTERVSLYVAFIRISFVFSASEFKQTECGADCDVTILVVGSLSWFEY